MEITFHRKLFEGFALCLFAFLFFVLHHLTDNDLFYAHYFLIFAGVVSLWAAYRKYAIIEKDGIIFYYGPSYSRQSLFLQWDDISKINIGNSDVGWTEGFSEISCKVSMTVTALKITLKKPLPSEQQAMIRDILESYLFPPNEAINGLGDEIIIKEPPHGGLKRFIDVASNISGKDYMKR